MVRIRTLEHFFRHANLPESEALKTLGLWRKHLWSFYCQAEAGPTVKADIIKYAVPLMRHFVDYLYETIGDVPVEMIVPQQQ